MPTDCPICGRELTIVRGQRAECWSCEKWFAWDQGFGRWMTYTPLAWRTRPGPVRLVAGA
jgi:hypothetical protein